MRRLYSTCTSSKPVLELVRLRHCVASGSVAVRALFAGLTRRSGQVINERSMKPSGEQREHHVGFKSSVRTCFKSPGILENVKL